MDRPGVRYQVPEGSWEQWKMEETGCKIICDAPTTLTVKGQMTALTAWSMYHRRLACKYCFVNNYLVHERLLEILFKVCLGAEGVVRLQWWPGSILLWWHANYNDWKISLVHWCWHMREWGNYFFKCSSVCVFLMTWCFLVNHVLCYYFSFFLKSYNY